MKKLVVIVSILCISQFAISGNSFNDQNFQKTQKTISSKDTLRSFAISNSVLAKGDWYRFYIDNTGIYKITPDFLEKLGMDVSKINPTKIKIFGNGGKMLPLINSANHEFDLKENAIEVVGGEDGQFSGNDYILLYGEGTNGYNEDSKTHLNLYDDKSYYFITADGEPGKRIANYIEPTKKADTIITSFLDYQFHEVDAVNLNNIGRRWFGNELSDKNNNLYRFNFPNRIINKPITCNIVVGTQYALPFEIAVLVNQKNKGNLQFPKAHKNGTGREKRFHKKIETMEENLSIALELKKSDNPVINTYLDYIGVSAERALKATDGQMRFDIVPSKTKNMVGEIIITSASVISAVWDITDAGAIQKMRHLVQKDTFKHKMLLNRKQSFIVLGGKDYLEPGFIENSKIPNQNLKGEIFLNDKGEITDLEYVIITTREMMLAAERLAMYRRTKDQMKVKVVDVQQVYNEFSSGKQDIGALRNFIRYIYESAPNKKKRLKYVCLFGDASIDYKNDRIKAADYTASEKNRIPSYESYVAFSKTSSYVSDDFFVSLAPESGELKGTDKLHVAVGRIPVNSLTNADEVVSKIIEYESEKSYGSWRNDFLLISDDVDKYWERMIQENLNRLGDTIKIKYPFFNTTKIFSDAFVQKSLTTGEKYPELTERLLQEIENGVGIINYFGHATEDGLSTEFFLSSVDAKKLNNKYKYPFFITVTCLATRFDNPAKTSVGEYLFRNPNGGAVGMITTTREIFSHVGVNVNRKLMDYLFSSKGKNLKPAEALMQMKNNMSSNHKRSVFFIGDPAMEMQIPKKGIKLTKINDIKLEKFHDTLKALTKVKLSGILAHESGKVRKKYNGVVAVRIFDKEVSGKTLANDRIKNKKGELVTLKFKNAGPLIYRGFTTVKNGKFDIEFVVPKDIHMQIGRCKILLYSKEKGSLEDYFGVYENVFLGGVQGHEIEDSQGPDIEMYIENEKRDSLRSITTNPVFRIKLSDKSGINLASGIGHDIVAILDSNYKQPIVLTESYRNNLNSYQQGEIRYQHFGLQPGMHTLTVKAWDTHNNFSTQKIDFRIEE